MWKVAEGAEGLVAAVVGDLKRWKSVGFGKRWKVVRMET